MNPDPQFDPDRPVPGLEPDPRDTRPVLVIPYMWIGDFVRCHTVVRVLRQRWPNRPVDMLSTTLCAPLADYMPGLRKAVVFDLPRGRIALDRQRALASMFRTEGYGDALVMPRTWKGALAPWLAGIPVRTGFIGEMRFGLLNDARRGEKSLPRMVDRCAALALPKGLPVPQDWPVPQLKVRAEEAAQWRMARGLGDAPAVVMAPGAVGPSKRWSYYGEAARELAGRGLDVWIIGGPGEMAAAQDIAAVGGPRVHNLTGTDLREAILALAAADAAISNDSGLLHVAAALGTPAVGIFGPTSPWHWAPLNPISAVIQAKTDIACRPCHKPVCRMVHHRCMRDIPVTDVVSAALAALPRPIPA